MAEQYKLIHPVKFVRDYIIQKVRPDGRKHDMFRPIGISCGSISKSLGSSLVKLGNTNIMCGVRAELAKPRAESPQNGYLIPNVDLSFLPFVSRNAASAADLSDKITSLISDILMNTNFIDLEDLCIHSDKLVWALHCDIICLEHDGCIFDAVVVACLAALKDLHLPNIKYDAAIDKVDISKGTTKLNIKYIPIVSTHVLLENSLLTDPSFEEECLSSAVIIIGISNGKLRFILKSGGLVISKHQLDVCIKRSMKREVDILKLL